MDNEGNIDSLTSLPADYADHADQILVICENLRDLREKQRIL